MTMEKITIRAFRAPDDPERCMMFRSEHERVLRDLGVSMVVKYDDAWMQDQDIIVFVAEHEDLGMVGGIRLQRAKTGSPMPMEKALETLAPDAIQELDGLIAKGNAELGALWNAHRFAGRGIPFLLISAAVSTATQADLSSMVCFVAEYIAPYCQNNGFIPMERFGTSGRFEYPIPGMRSYVMQIPDVHSLEHATLSERLRAISLRLRPEQVRMEVPKRTELMVSYELLLNPADSVYQRIAADRSRFAA